MEIVGHGAAGVSPGWYLPDYLTSLTWEYGRCFRPPVWYR